jgi:quinol monooxygenase YgiN
MKTDNKVAREASYIAIEAKAGMEEELAALFAGAAPLVAAHEPGTLSWFALRLDQRRFAIFDAFADEAGRSAHFAAPVANALKEAAGRLVEGGWEQGVVAQVRNARVLSATW